MEARKRVGVNIQRLRRQHGLSQEELGERVRVHQTYLSHLENGKRNPSLDLLVRFAEVFGVDVSELFVR